MIILYLTTPLASFIAEHLPADDPLRTGLAERIAHEELLPCPEPPELMIMRRGRCVLEVYDEAEAERIDDVLSAPWAWNIVQAEKQKQARRTA